MIGTPLPAVALGGLVNGGDLRHADAGDDPRRADRAGPDADLDRIRPRRHDRLGPFLRGHVAGDHVDGVAFLDLRAPFRARCSNGRGPSRLPEHPLPPGSAIPPVPRH